MTSPANAPALFGWLRATLFPAGSDATAARVATLIVGADQVSPPAGKPADKIRRKPLGPKQLRWLRTHVQPFRDLEALMKATKDGIAPMGGKAK